MSVVGADAPGGKMNLVEKIKKFFFEYKEPRYRDRRAWYASSLTGCRRDLYWEAIGEPPTETTDLVGRMRMNVGKWIEEGFLNDVVNNLHWFGLHAVSSKKQIPIGLSSPTKVDGYIDGLLVERDGEKFGKPYVLEVKTKNGYGADEFAKNFIPDDSYLAQMGLYLHDLSSKGVTDQGILLYVLLSDNNYGTMVQIDLKYDASTGIVRAFRARTLLGEDRAIEAEFDVKKALQELSELDKAVETRTVPAPSYQYKYPVTEEMAAALTDYRLQAILEGKRVEGDWQPKYSRYKTKQLETDGVSLGYTEAEMEIFQREWAARKPRSKKFQKAG
jgi:hypothetical protein